MRVFYVIYVSDDHLRSALDTIRLICADGAVAHSAHITVRGPSRQRRSLEALNGVVAGREVVLPSPGYFLKREQHTVFFRAAVEGLERAWHKPDFPFNPHLTMYDGPSRPRAIELQQMLARLPITVTFKARGLEPLVSASGQTNLAMIENIDFEFVSKVTRLDVDSSRILQLEDRYRDAIVERLCRYLATKAPPPDEVPPQELNDGLGLASGWSLHARPRSAQDRPRSASSTHSQSGVCGRTDPIAEAWESWGFLHRPARRALG